MSAPRGPRAPRPKCCQVGGPHAGPRPRPREPREARGDGHRVPARGSAAAAAMIPALALPKLAGAPRPAPGLGPGLGWGPGRGRPPPSPPHRRPRTRGERGGRGQGRFSSAPFSSSFWAARRGPLPAGVGSGRAAPGAGRGALAPVGSGGAGPGCRGARVQNQASVGRAGGTAACQVQQPLRAQGGCGGDRGHPRCRGLSHQWGLSLARGSRGPENGALGRSPSGVREWKKLERTGGF